MGNNKPQLNNCQVRLIPDLSAAALKSHQDIGLAMWYCLRSINSNGSGCIWLEKAIGRLMQDFDYSASTADRQILEARGRYLDITHEKGRATIKIYAPLRVCERLGITRLSDKHFRRISAKGFNSLLKRRAQIYASVLKPEGIKANPLSRETIEELTGLSKTQQRRYDKAARVKRSPNYAFFRDNSPLGEAKFLPIKQEIYTKSQGHREVNKRLGNTYHSRQFADNVGMLRKVNAQLRRRSLLPEEASSLVKRFFLTFRQLSKSLTRRTRIDKIGFYLINNGNRTIQGRKEWCYASI